MSEQELISELPSTDFCPEETPQDTRTDMDDLKEIFAKCKTKQEALELMHRNKTEQEGSKKFSYNGKNYGLSNARKAINRLAENNNFKGETPQLTLTDATYKMEAPDIPIRVEPQQTVQQTITEPTSTQTQQTVNDPYDYTQPQQQTPPQQVEPLTKEFIPPQKELVASCTDIVNDIIDMIPNIVKDDTGKVAKVWSASVEKRERLGYNLAVVTGQGGKYVNPTTLAWLSLGGFFVTNVIATLPEIISTVKSVAKTGGKS